jgi:hypothetical protein
LFATTTRNNIEKEGMVWSTAGVYVCVMQIGMECWAGTENTNMFVSAGV